MQNCIYFCTFVLIQGQVNRNFQLVLNEMGPGRTSRAWYFHSPAACKEFKVGNNSHSEAIKAFGLQ